MSAYLLPKLIAESAALSELFEKLLQHAHHDRVHAYALGFGPLPQFHPSFVTDMKQHGVREAKSGLAGLNDRDFARVHVRHGKQDNA